MVRVHCSDPGGASRSAYDAIPKRQAWPCRCRNQAQRGHGNTSASTSATATPLTRDTSARRVSIRITKCLWALHNQSRGNTLPYCADGTMLLAPSDHVHKHTCYRSGGLIKALLHMGVRQQTQALTAACMDGSASGQHSTVAQIHLASRTEKDKSLQPAPVLDTACFVMHPLRQA